MTLQVARQLIYSRTISNRKFPNFSTLNHMPMAWFDHYRILIPLAQVFIFLCSYVTDNCFQSSESAIEWTTISTLLASHLFFSLLAKYPEAGILDGHCLRGSLSRLLSLLWRQIGFTITSRTRTAPTARTTPPPKMPLFCRSQDELPVPPKQRSLRNISKGNYSSPVYNGGHCSCSYRPIS